MSKAFDKVWHEGLLYKLRSMGISGKLYKFLENYLSGRFQNVVLNGQTSSWRLAWVPQGSILCPLLFLIYINDLPNELKSNVKFFADVTSLFTIVKDKNESPHVLSNNLLLISKWAFNWRMLFNPDPSKPAQEVLFSRKAKIQNYPTISLNNIQVERVFYQKHLGLIPVEKLKFKQHIDSAISKINKGIAVIKNLRYSLPRKSLITIYKAFLKPLIDYGDIIFDQPQYESFYEKLESIQYEAVLATTGSVQGSPHVCMFKIMKEKAPDYLKNLIPISQSFRTRKNRVPTSHCRTDCFKSSFFPSTLSDWFMLDVAIRNSESIAVFKSRLPSFICLDPSNVYNIFDPIGLKLLTRLRLGFSHLNEHRF